MMILIFYLMGLMINALLYLEPLAAIDDHAALIGL